MATSQYSKPTFEGYKDEILHTSIQSYVDTLTDFFLLKGDNRHPHEAENVKLCLKKELSYVLIGNTTISVSIQ